MIGDIEYVLHWPASPLMRRRLGRCHGDAKTATNYGSLAGCPWQGGPFSIGQPPRGVEPFKTQPSLTKLGPSPPLERPPKSLSRTS